MCKNMPSICARANGEHKHEEVASLANNNGNRNRVLVPQAQNALEQFKYEIATELGIPTGTTMSGGQRNEQSYQAMLDNWKYEVAEELGIRADVEQRGWANMTSRECGRVGGRMGGKIGGQMVRRLIQVAEQSLIGK
jgi:hypothetical protein